MHDGPTQEQHAEQARHGTERKISNAPKHTAAPEVRIHVRVSARGTPLRTRLASVRGRCVRYDRALDRGAGSYFVIDSDDTVGDAGPLADLDSVP